MTFLGKAFTVFLAFLSVVFFALSILINASHVDYRNRVKDPATGLEVRLKAGEEKNRQLTTLLDEIDRELKVERAAQSSALAALETQLELREKEISDLNVELLRVLTSHTELVKSEAATQKDLRARTVENEAVQKQIVDSRENRNQLYTQLVKTIDDYNRLQGMYQSLQERREQLTSTPY